MTSAAARHSLAPAEGRYVVSVTASTLEGLATMYDPRPIERQLSTAEVLRSLTPNERRYVQGIMALSPQQLHAAYGAARP